MCKRNSTTIRYFNVQNLRELLLLNTNDSKEDNSEKKEVSPKQAVAEELQVEAENNDGNYELIHVQRFKI